jgi:hypothetical protein
MMRNGTNQMCLFWAKHNMDRMLWGKHEGDGMQLTPTQSMISGFSAAFLGPIATGEWCSGCVVLLGTPAGQGQGPGVADGCWAEGAGAACITLLGTPFSGDSRQPRTGSTVHQ